MLSTKAALMADQETLYRCHDAVNEDGINGLIKKVNS